MYEMTLDACHFTVRSRSYTQKDDLPQLCVVLLLLTFTTCDESALKQPEAEASTYANVYSRVEDFTNE